MATKNSYIGSVAAKLSKFVNKTDLEAHFTLKTGDRAPNKEHCRAVCTLAVEAYEKDREGFVKLAQELSYNSLHRFMMAATGRPYKDRKSGKNSGAQFQADSIANCCLTELAHFMHRERPDVKYANCTDGLKAKLQVRSKYFKAAPRTTPRNRKAATTAK